MKPEDVLAMILNASSVKCDVCGAGAMIVGGGAFCAAHSGGAAERLVKEANEIQEKDSEETTGE